MNHDPHRLQGTVLMTVDTVGGTWTYALELARALEPYGLEIALASMGGPLSPEQHRAIRTARNVDLYESRYRMEWMEDPWSDIDRAGDWLLGIEKRVAPLAVHLNGYCHAALPWSAPVLITAHSCVLSWWRAVHGCDAPSDLDRYAVRVAAGLRSADMLVAPTAAMMQAVARHYGPLAMPSRVIPNGRNPELFKPAKKEEIILAAGRVWDEAKNVSSLAAVAADLPWPVKVAGRFTHPDGRRMRFANVRPLGMLVPPAMAREMSRAAVFVAPARYEPFGLAILEAALSGCALVLGDIPSLRENWEGAADFVDPDDPRGLYDVLMRLIGEPRRRRKRAAAARKRAANFSADAMGRAYLGAYRALGAQEHPVAARANLEAFA